MSSKALLYNFGDPAGMVASRHAMTDVWILALGRRMKNICPMNLYKYRALKENAHMFPV